MKYYSSNTKRTKGGLIAVVVGCLLAIGGAGWFALSRYNASVDVKPESHLTPQKSYSDEAPSYTDSEPDVPSSDVADPVSDVPYEKEPEPPAQSYALPLEGKIIKGYSDSALQFSATYGDLRLHTGVDIAAEAGATVFSCANGTVTAVDESGSFGKFVTVDHGEGLSIRYCGLETVGVTVGQKLTTGDEIGTVGTVPCECADPSHIHLEAVKDGETTSFLGAIGLER